MVRALRATRRATGDGGVTVVLTVLLVVGLLVIVALVVDIGGAANQRRQAQNVADPAALAGAWALTDASAATSGAVVDDARRYAEGNIRSPLTPSTGCRSEGVCFGSDDGWKVSVLTPYASPRVGVDPDRSVRVEACRDVPTSFAAVIGIRSMRVCGKAAAGADAAAVDLQPGVLVLGKPKLEQPGAKGTKKALHTHGTIEVVGGTVQINSRHAKEAAVLHRPSVTRAESVDVTGAAKRSAGTVVEQALRTGVPTIGDPLAGIDEPAVPRSWPGETKVDKATRTLAPGVYGKLKIEHGGKVILQGPGAFVFNGIEVKDAGSTLKSVHALVYNVGKFSVTGGADVELKAMAPSHAVQAGLPKYAGIAFFQARCRSKDVGTEKCDDVNKAKGQKVQLKGKKDNGGSWSFDGAFYAPNSKVEIKGESELFDAEIDNDDDEANDWPDDDTDTVTSPYDPELAVDFSKSLLVAGELNVGRRAQIRIDTAWPPAAVFGGVGLIE